MGKKRVAKKAGDIQTEQTAKEAVQPSFTQTPGVVRQGRIYIFSSYNNTIMSLTDEKGSVLKNVSAGAIGFTGTKKSTPFAASKVADMITQFALQKGIGRADVYVKGTGTGRDAALRTIGSKDLEITSIKDITPIPHNGPKPPKVRRV